MATSARAAGRGGVRLTAGDARRYGPAPMRSRLPSVPSWTLVLAGLVAVRLAPPLLVLAASGHDLPGLPPYDYAPLNGDATGFYAEARELISAAFGPAGAAAALDPRRRAPGRRGGSARAGRRSSPLRSASRSPASPSSSAPSRPAPPSSAGRCCGRSCSSRSVSSAFSIPTSPSSSACSSRSPRTRSRSSRSRTPAAGRAAAAPSASPPPRSSRCGRC